MSMKLLFPLSGRTAPVVKCGFCGSTYRQDKDDCPNCGGCKPVATDIPSLKSVPAVGRESLGAITLGSSTGGMATGTIRPYRTADGTYRISMNLVVSRFVGGVEILTGDLEIPTEMIP